MFNIIARRTLLAYCSQYPLAANALKQWYAEWLERDFTSFNDLKAVYGSVSIVGDDRAVFNIMGNKYRLVVRMASSTRPFKSSGLALMLNTIKLM